MATRILVEPALHVRRFYHVLACLDVGQVPASVFHPAYRDRVLGLRPGTAPRPDALLGSYHRRFRACAGRHALPLVPLVSRELAQHEAVMSGLVRQGAAAPHLTAWAKRALAPLADKSGARLLGTVEAIAEQEWAVCLEALERTGQSVFGDDGAGLSSYLERELLPLSDLLFGETPQSIVVFPCEAVGRRSWSVLLDRTEHRIVTAPNLKTAYLQALVGLCRHRTDRLIRPYLPEDIRRDPNHPLNRQMRLDAAYTVAFHVLQRHRSDHLDTFVAWVTRQFEDTSRRPDAAVEALRPMALIPADARDAVHRVVGGR